MKADTGQDTPSHSRVASESLGAPAPTERTGVAVLGFLALFLLMVVRRPTGVTSGTLWAEDGNLFIQDWLRSPVDPSGIWNVLSDPYTGQLWPLQRAVSGIVSMLPTIMWSPLMYLASCAIAAAAISILLQRRAFIMFGRLGWRMTTAALLVALPAVAEIQGNLANVQWYLAAGLMVALVLPAPSTTWGRTSEFAFVTVTAITGVVGILLAPLAMWAMVTARRDPDCSYRRWRSGVVLAAALVNIISLTGRPRSKDGFDYLLDAQSWAVVVTRLGKHVLPPLDTASTSVPWIYVAAILALALTLTIALFDRTGPSLWWLASGIAAAVGGLVSGAHTVNAQAVVDVSTRHVALILVAMTLIVGRGLGTKSGVTWVLSLGTGLLLAPSILATAQLPPMGPPITDAAARTFDECLHDPDLSCQLPIAPTGWSISVEGR